MTDDEAAEYIGRRVLADADKLRLFVPDCYARFRLRWHGSEFEVCVILKDESDDAIGSGEA